MLKRVASVMVLLGLALVAPCRAAEVPLPVQVDGFILAPVNEALGKSITDAQDMKDVAFTIAIDGAKAEKLAVSPERLRDYQNVYYRIVGQPGERRLEENGFSPAGADDESKLIRRALGVPAEKKIHFLPGREHLLIPAKSSAVLRAGGQTWSFQAGTVGAGRGRTRAVLVRNGQAVPLAFAEAVGSATALEGNTVKLTVTEDVQSEGLVVIAKGTETEAKVVKVEKPGFFGNPGAVTLEMGAVASVDGRGIPLLANGKSRVTYKARPSCLFSRGRNVTVAAGTTLPSQAAWTGAVLAAE